MDGIAFDFAGKFAFLEVLDQLEKVNLIDAFSGEKIFLVDYAIRFLVIVNEDTQNKGASTY
jgi:hypothetical protein